MRRARRRARGRNRHLPRATRARRGVGYVFNTEGVPNQQGIQLLTAVLIVGAGGSLRWSKNVQNQPRSDRWDRWLGTRSSPLFKASESPFLCALLFFLLRSCVYLVFFLFVVSYIFSMVGLIHTPVWGNIDTPVESMSLNAFHGATLSHQQYRLSLSQIQILDAIHHMSLM